ncbi:MAG: hypothetical protein H6811_01600 [Phycisphaeraceae bacterium]|nr:hypothetical protein [Phycisphaeraceae bacterium]
MAAYDHAWRQNRDRIHKSIGEALQRWGFEKQIDGELLAFHLLECLDECLQLREDIESLLKTIAEQPTIPRIMNAVPPATGEMWHLRRHCRGATHLLDELYSHCWDRLRQDGRSEDEIEDMLLDDTG